MRIADIRIGDRHRKNMGDIEGLAKSIADIGLLHPVVVTPDGLLIAGLRRLEACKRLGWTDVPVRLLANGDKFESGGNLFTLDDIGKTCAVCGYPFAHVHHALPRQFGGKDIAENIVDLCPNHHAAIHFLLQMDIWMCNEENRKRLDGMSKDESSHVLARYEYMNHCDPTIVSFYQEHVRPMLDRQVTDGH